LPQWEKFLSDLDQDVLETAARATINRRFAASYAHDVRGTLQALYSALELLARSAQGGNAAKIEKAHDLARRAMGNHERLTMDVLSSLSQESSKAAEADLGGLVADVVTFLRNDAAAKGVKLIGTRSNVLVSAPRAELRTLLIGLVAAVIDAAPSGSEVHIATAADGADAVVTIDSPPGSGLLRATGNSRMDEAGLSANDLTFRFAQHFLAAHGGRLVTAGTESRGSLRMYYPLSLAEMRASATAK
jgi:signal transduction histidine kinase